MFQMKEQDKSSGRNLMKQRCVIELIKFKVVIIKMLTKLQRRMYEQSENFRKDGKYKKYQKEVRELKNIITENTLEAFSSRLDAEDRVSQLGNKTVNCTQSEQKK